MVSGRDGSGKSSMAAWAVTPLDGMFGVVVPVHAHAASPDVSGAYLAGLVIDALRTAAWRSVLDIDLADSSRRRWRRSASVNFGVLQAGLEEQLPAAGGTSLAERQDAVHQALAVVRDHGLEPVLILDDTDKWIRLGGEPDEAVETFFNGPVRWLVDLSAGLIVHVHDRYLDLLGPSSGWFDERVAPPALDSDQLRQVVLGRIEAVEPGVQEVFEPEALSVLLDTVATQGQSIRTCVRLAGHAVTEAVIAGKDHVARQDVEAAILDAT